jgi:hypothetical protein
MTEHSVKVTNTAAVKTSVGGATVTSSVNFKTVPTQTATGTAVVPTGPVQFTGGAGKASGGVMAAVVAIIAMVL